MQWVESIMSCMTLNVITETRHRLTTINSNSATEICQFSLKPFLPIRCINLPQDIDIK